MASISVEVDIDEFAEVCEMTEWKKIIDGGPAYDEHVLLRSQDGSILQGFRTTRGYVTRFSNYVTNPTHWMPLPPPPRDE